MSSGIMMMHIYKL